jgi:hypothetical protein
LDAFGEVFNDKETAIVMRIRDFMQRCPMIERLKVDQCKGYAGFLKNGNLPNFRSFKGCLLLAQDALETCTLTNLEIVNVVRLDSLTRLFELAPTCSLNLTSLSLIINRWDMEFLHAVVTTFQSLERLRLRYCQGYPDQVDSFLTLASRYCAHIFPLPQDTLIGLGARFLINYPKLREIRLYNPWSTRASYDELWTDDPRVVPGDDYQQSLQQAVRDEHANSSLAALDIQHTALAAAHNDPLDHAEGKEPILPTTGKCAPWTEIKKWDAEADAQREVTAAWKRWCPELRELQLVPQYSWRRCSSQDAWSRRLTFWEDIVFD